MPLRDVVYLALSLEELAVLHECMRIAVEEGSVLLKDHPDPGVTFNRSRLIYTLAGRMERLVPPPLQSNRRSS